jgi:hypothetical protein
MAIMVTHENEIALSLASQNALGHARLKVANNRLGSKLCVSHCESADW